METGISFTPTTNIERRPRTLPSVHGKKKDTSTASEMFENRRIKIKNHPGIAMKLGRRKSSEQKSPEKETIKTVVEDEKKPLPQAVRFEEAIESIPIVNVPDHGFAHYFRDNEILKQYKSLANNPPSGVYVIPSLKTLQVWFGIIFVRYGLYGEGIFRFELIIPDDFPQNQPLIKFITPMFHPHIHPISGVFSQEPKFSKWDKQNHIWQVIHYLKHCFYQHDETSGVLNPEAAEMKANSPDLFRRRVRVCVLESMRLFESECSVTDTSEDDGNVLKHRKLNLADLERGKAQILRAGRLCFQR